MTGSCPFSAAALANIGKEEVAAPVTLRVFVRAPPRTSRKQMRVRAERALRSGVVAVQREINDRARTARCDERERDCSFDKICTFGFGDDADGAL